tara:strand:- start:3445 stop:4215 length:771 start_codon:yes stop_codon:yes gene_type:complete
LNFIIKSLLNIIPRELLISVSILFRPFLDFFYRGSKFHDPINNKSYRKFLPYGYNNIRDNALSPGSLSLERHRLLWLYLQNETQIFKKKFKVLHVAPEQAFYKKFIKLNNLDYVTFDMNSPIAKIKGDICNLPFSENQFDFILCNHVLEHVNDDIAAMLELFRVLKKNGVAILQVPIDLTKNKTYEDSTITDKKERMKAFGQYDHVRIYGKDYFERLEKSGFKVEKNFYSKNFSDEEIYKYGINKNEIIPICRKLF